MSHSHHRPPDPATTPTPRTRVALYLLGGGATPAVLSCLTAHPCWTLVRQPYRDRKPGPLATRPALRRALTDAHAGAFDVLVVDRISQLSRSIDELAVGFQNCALWPWPAVIVKLGRRA
jgi:site-specific DNA recombinase